LAQREGRKGGREKGRKGEREEGRKGERVETFTLITLADDCDYQLAGDYKTNKDVRTSNRPDSWRW
jgi:hypothetical protein